MLNSLQNTTAACAIYFIAQLALPGQPETYVEAVTKASQMSDRWLFLAAICIIFLGGVATVRYLVKAIDAKDALHAGYIEKTYTENVKLTAQVIIALQENNRLLAQVQKLMEELKDNRH
jgi:hypothetical protein